MGRPVLLPDGLHLRLTHGDPGVLPAGERVREGRRPGPRGQHRQQVFPPRVGQPRAGDACGSPAGRLHQAGFEGLRGPAGGARGRAAGDVHHRPGRACPRVDRTGPFRGKERRRDSAAPFRPQDRRAVPRRVEARQTVSRQMTRKPPAASFLAGGFHSATFATFVRSLRFRSTQSLPRSIRCPTSKSILVGYPSTGKYGARRGTPRCVFPPPGLPVDVSRL